MQYFDGGGKVCKETCGAPVWEAGEGYVHFVDLHEHFMVLLVQVNITASAEKAMFCFVSLALKTTTLAFFSLHDKHSLPCNLHVDRVLFTLIFLQQNNKFQLICAVLCQNLRARQKRGDVVTPHVECGQCASAEAAFSCEGEKNEVLLLGAAGN